MSSQEVHLPIQLERIPFQRLPGSIVRAVGRVGTQATEPVQQGTAVNYLPLARKTGADVGAVRGNDRKFYSDTPDTLDPAAFPASQPTAEEFSEEIIDTIKNSPHKPL